MEKEITFGLNKTGISTAPILSKEMPAGALKLTIPPAGSEMDLAVERTDLTAAFDSVGSVPLPTTIKGVLNTGAQLLKGNNAKYLIDKLGERLGFERQGTRLYDALISKRRAESALADDVYPLEVLERFRNDEMGHFQLVAQTISDLGGDPTALTPCADVAAAAGMGIQQIMTDPKVKFTQALQGILIAELTDNAGWELLIPIVREAGLEEVAQKYESALLTEQEHLIVVREWLEQIFLTKPEDARISA